MIDTLQPADVIKVALFVDFDNIYTGLKKVHPKAAEEFATDPARWLAWFEQGMPNRDADGPNLSRHRALLLRHCYLNPKTFGNYRAYFTRSAFRVVDCPSLTLQNKNSTDIHMVMDILDVLRHETRFDEFIILSGDSDFTPVLLRLRLFNRRTVILTPGPVAQSYKAASDHVISEDVFIEDGLLILPDRAPRPAVAAVQAQALNNEQVLDSMAQRIYEKVVVEGVVRATALPTIYGSFQQFRNSNNWLGFYSLIDLTTELTRRNPELVITDCIVGGKPSWEVRLRAGADGIRPALPSDKMALVHEAEGADTGTAVVAAPSVDVLREQILACVKELVAASSSRVDMAWAAGEVIRRLGPTVRITEWAGAGSFKDLLLTERARGFDVVTSPAGTGYLIDPSRHTPPVAAVVELDWDGYPDELVAFARRINTVTGAPLLRPDEYALVFKVLEEELSENSYFLSTTSRAVRDRCAERGKAVARKDISFILKGIAYAGHEFEDNPLSDTAEVFALVFRDNVLKLCKGAQLELSEQEIVFLHQWISF